MRIMKVARTLADLDTESDINTTHLAEAIPYRDSQAVKPSRY